MDPAIVSVLLGSIPSDHRFPVFTSAVGAGFNGMQTSFVVVYNPFWKVPQIQSFVATPDYINIGSQSTLTWLISDCSAYCQVRLEGRDGLNFTDLVESHPNRSPSGSLQVSPTRSTHTRYTLTASNPNGFNALRIATVQLAPPSSPQPGQVFYFRMENAGSVVTTCFTSAIFAPDQAIAKQLAEAQNGGYTATGITESQYLAGC